MAGYRTTVAKPPKQVTPALHALRAKWYETRLNKPDWASNANAQRWANACMRERKAA